ncbi:MAG: hypothetical protein ACT4ON_10840 [Bacteroidota bacterium]
MKKNILKLSFVIGAIALVSCGGNDHADNANTAMQDSIPATDTNSAQQTVFYNMPSPLETFTILKLSGATFDKSLLNPVDKISKYTSNASKAINLGIYSTDLSMSFMYKQNQEINLYLKNVSDLTTSLQIDGSYGQAVFKRMQANENNLDSLMQIVSEASVNTDLYLKENQRTSAVVLIAAGAWIESLHIIANIANKTQKEDMIALVADQRVAVTPLVKMLEQHQSDADIASVTTDIKELASIFESLQPTEVAAASVTAEKNITRVGNNKNYSLSKEQLKSILEKTEAIRNKFIN